MYFLNIIYEPYCYSAYDMHGGKCEKRAALSSFLSNIASPSAKYIVSSVTIFNRKISEIICCLRYTE